LIIYHLQASYLIKKNPEKIQHLWFPNVEIIVVFLTLLNSLVHQQLTTQICHSEPPEGGKKIMLHNFENHAALFLKSCSMIFQFTLHNF